MSKQQRSVTEKKLVVLEMLKGHSSISQIAKAHGMSDSLAYRWRNEALQAMEERFATNGRRGDQAAEAERQRLLHIIGEQAVVIDTLKKISELS